MRHRVLIAEGDVELQFLYEMFLTECGFDVDLASDGLDCLDKLQHVRPAVLVLDRDLRCGGGDGVLAWLRAESTLAGVPVILTDTGPDSLEDAPVIEWPVVGSLSKPFGLSTFLKRVQAAAGRGSAAEQTRAECTADSHEMAID